jgi:iron complex transport system permease protein
LGVRDKQVFAMLILAILLLMVSLISLGTGAVLIQISQVVAIIGKLLKLPITTDFTGSQQQVLESIRMPRIVLGVLIGSALSLSGAVMQGLFRNPLADPALIGVSSGAVLAAVAVIVLGGTLLTDLPSHYKAFLLPAAAFGGGFIATISVYRFATVKGRADIASLLMAGIAINAIAGAATGLLIYLADDEQLRTLTFWSMGSLGGANWQELKVGAPLLVFTLLLMPVYARKFNILLLGEAEATHLGLNIESIKTQLIFLVALSVGTAVS